MCNVELSIKYILNTIWDNKKTYTYRLHEISESICENKLKTVEITMPTGSVRSEQKAPDIYHMCRVDSGEADHIAPVCRDIWIQFCGFGYRESY